MKRLNLLLLLSLLGLLLLNCGPTKLVPAQNVDQTQFEVIYKKMIGVAGGTGIIAPPAISNDLTRKFSISMGGGKLFIENIDGKEKEVVYLPGEDSEFDKMESLPDAGLADIPDNAGDPSEYIRRVYAEDPQKGAILAATMAFANMTKKLGEDLRHIIDISWSPDNSAAVLLVFAPTSYKSIYFIMDTKTFATRPLMKFYPPIVESSGREHQSESVIYNCGASWKSNSTVVLSTFMGADGAEYYNLMEVDIETGEATIINENDVIKAYFSPDGKKTAFFRPGGEYIGRWYSDKSSLESYFSKLNLYIGDADFSNEKLIAEDIHENKRVSWSPDSRYLAFVQDGTKSITGTTSTLQYYDTAENTAHDVCTGKFLNTPLFTADNTIVFFLMDTHIYKYTM